MTFRKEVLIRRLKDAKKTQESVQSNSKFIIHYHDNAAASCEAWVDVYQNSPVEVQLALWYVANEVVQTAGNKRRGLGTLFKETFKPNLEKALPLTVDNSKQEQFHKVITVWEERRVYDKPFCDKLKNILNLISIAASTSTPSYSRNNSAQSQSDADDPLGTDFIARIDSPTLDETGSNSSDPRLVSRGQFASQNQTGLQNALEDKDRLLRAAAIYSDYQLTIVHELLEKCCKVQSEADLLKKQYELNAFDISSMDAFKGLKELIKTGLISKSKAKDIKEKSEGKKAKLQFENVASRLSDLVNQLENQNELQNQVLDHILASQMYFKQQQSEAIVVCKAYKNFGSRILSLRKKLREKKKTLPDLSTLTSNDMELDNEDEEQEPVGNSPGTVTGGRAHSSSNIIQYPSVNTTAYGDTGKSAIENNVKPLDAPSTLNAVNDIMRQLMSRVNSTSSTTMTSQSGTFFNSFPSESSQLANRSSPNNSSCNFNSPPVMIEATEIVPVSSSSSASTSPQKPKPSSPDSKDQPTTTALSPQMNNFNHANPLMTSYYTSYTKPATTVAAAPPPAPEQPLPVAESENPPLPPSDSGEGGGITPTFFEALARINSPEKPFEKKIDKSPDALTNVNSASSKSGESKTDQLSSSIPVTFYESTTSNSPFSQAFSAPYVNPNANYGPPAFFNTNSSHAGYYNSGRYTGPTGVAQTDSSGLAFPPVAINSFQSPLLRANQDVDLRSFSSQPPNQRKNHANKEPPGNMGPAFAILPTPPNHPPPHLEFESGPPWDHDENMLRDPRKRGRGGAPPFGGTSAPKRPFRGGRFPYRGFLNPNHRGASRNVNEWSNEPGYSTSQSPSYDQDYRRFESNNSRGGFDGGRRPGRSRGRGRNYWTPVHNHPRMEHPDMSCPEMGDAEGEPRTIKQVMQNFGGDDWMKATVGDEIETSPKKLVVTTGNNASEDSDSYSPTKPSISASNRKVPDEMDHFEAIKRARDVASEFDVHIEDSLNKRPKQSERNQNWSRESGKSPLKSKSTKERLPSDEDASIPIVMQSDSDQFSSSESSPIKSNPSFDAPPKVVPSKDQNKSQTNVADRNEPPLHLQKASDDMSAATKALKLIGNVDTSSPEYAKWWFYHFGRGGAANVGTNAAFHQPGVQNASHIPMK